MRHLELLDQDGVGAAQKIGALARHFAQNAHAEPRSRERMAIHHLPRQSELEPELAHFVLEQLAQRLQELEVQRLGQPSDVVMRLDGVRLLGLGTRGLDDVRIDRSLREPLHVAQLGGFALEHFDEQAPDDLPLLLGIGDAGKRRQEFVARIDVIHAHAEILRKRMHDLLRLVQAQEAVIDEDAGETIADRAMDQRRGHRRIHAAGEAEQHLLVAGLRR